MKDFSLLFLASFVLSLIIFVLGLIKTIKDKKAFFPTPYLFFLGIFVWGDAVILGLFWMIFFLSTYFLKNYFLFLFIVSLFWLVRSLGEIIYWLNQQFSPLKRNPPEKLFGYFIFKNESIWFAYQIFWQLILIISIILTLYFGNLWLKGL